MDVPVSMTRPTFQMPLDWSVPTALGLVGLAEAAAKSSSLPISATVEGYSAPSVVDVGCASLRIRFAPEDCEAIGDQMLSAQCSIALAVRRKDREGWLPGVAGVPGHHEDRDGRARRGLLEAVIMARPTTSGGITFLHEDVLREWAPVGVELQLVPVRRVDDFHIDDGSGPWLRDRICITASQAEDFVAACQVRDQPISTSVEALLNNTGLRADTAVQCAPEDEWDLARKGNLHRDCGESALAAAL